MSLEDLCAGRLAVARHKPVKDPVLKRIEQMRRIHNNPEIAPFVRALDEIGQQRKSTDQTKLLSQLQYVARMVHAKPNGFLPVLESDSRFDVFCEFALFPDSYAEIRRLGLIVVINSAASSAPLLQSLVKMDFIGVICGRFLFAQDRLPDLGMLKLIVTLFNNLFLAIPQLAVRFVESGRYSSFQELLAQHQTSEVFDVLGLLIPVFAAPTFPSSLDYKRALLSPIQIIFQRGLFSLWLDAIEQLMGHSALDFSEFPAPAFELCLQPDPSIAARALALVAKFLAIEPDLQLPIDDFIQLALQFGVPEVCIRVHKVILGYLRRHPIPVLEQLIQRRYFVAFAGEIESATFGVKEAAVELWMQALVFGAQQHFEECVDCNSLLLAMQILDRKNAALLNLFAETIYSLAGALAGLAIIEQLFGDLTRLADEIDEESSAKAVLIVRLTAIRKQFGPQSEGTGW
jgi:hypothetical protein